MLNVAVPGAWRGEGAKAAGDHTTVQFSLPDGVAFAGSTVTIALAK
jgi:hypothetical protein